MGKHTDSISAINLDYYDKPAPSVIQNHSTAHVSPVVPDEGVSGFRVRIGAHSCYAAVHVDPQRDVVTLEDRCLDAHHVTLQVDAGRPLRLPVI